MSERVSNAALDLMCQELPSNVAKDLERRINEDLLGENKYAVGKKEFLDVDVFRRLMNKIFGYKWSWEIIKYDIVGQDYVYVLGRLSVPGVGVKEAFGSVKLNAKDSSNSFSAANSLAFKSACKMVGVGQSILDNEFELPVFEDEVQKQPVARPQAQAPAQQAPKPVVQWSEEQIKAMVTFKKAYSITDNNKLLAFLQTWNPAVKVVTELTPSNVDVFLNFVATNPAAFVSL